MIEPSSLAAPPDPDGSWPRRSLFETASWLHAPWFQTDYRYLTTPSGEPEAATVAKVVEDPSEYDAHNLRDLFSLVPPVFPEQEGEVAARAAAGPVGDEAWFPNVVAMFPGYVSTILTRPDADTGTARGALLAELERWARSEDLRAVAFPYVDGADAELAAALAGAGYRRAPMTQRSRLRLEPGDVDTSYYARLPARRAREVRRERRALAARGVVVGREALDGPTFDAVLELRLGLIAKYGHDIDRHKEETRLRWLAGLGDDVELYVGRVDGRMLGFTLFLAHGSTWIAYMTGSVAGPEGRGLYFATAFYEPIDQLVGRIDAPIELDYGIGHSPAKTWRGAVASPLDGWLLPLDETLARWVDRGLA